MPRLYIGGRLFNIIKRMEERSSEKFVWVAVVVIVIIAIVASIAGKIQEVIFLFSQPPGI